MPAGRKGKYKEWLKPENLIRLQGWARDGMTDEDIARQKLHINPSTLCEWKNKYPEIDKALKMGQEVADYIIENALFKAAKEGNVTAMIFWLKNRKKNKWRDKPEPDKNAEALGAAIKTLADIIEKPVKNRDIKDFEE